MAGLSDNVNVNTDAPQENNNNNPNTCVDPLPGFHIYSWSERHRNRVIPAHLTYQSRPVPSLPNPPKRPQYPDERSRLLLEGLRNNGRFVLTGILNDLEDERRAEEARAQKALETEHAALKRKKEAKQTAATSAASIETETEQTIEAGRQIETDQTRQTPPSFDTEFDEDRGIFSDPLAEFNGEDPFADFDGNHTQLHSEINYQEDRGNLSESDSNTSGGYESDNEESDGEEESSSEEGSDQDTEEGSSSEDEFHGTDPFADFSGDYTHLNGPIDFGEDLTDGSTSEEDSETGLELGRTPESEQDVNQGLEQDHDIEIYDDEDMDSIDEILAAAHSADFTHEEGDEDEDMGDDVDLDYEDGEDIEDEDDHDLDALPLAPFNPIAMGLKEIGGLAHFRVSSYKPGNGVDELKNDDTDRYWQSDGVQPHRLTMAFVKQAEIRALRFYVDYIQDESYTPTKIIWKAGTSENNLFKFAESELVNPSGWVDVPIAGAGGGEDGNSLMAWVVRMEVVENHQNGKDTHIRGLKIYGFDDQLRAAGPTTGGVLREGGEGGGVFKMDETKSAEDNEKALMAHLRNRDFERSLGAGDPSGTASSLDFIEDPVLR